MPSFSMPRRHVGRCLDLGKMRGHKGPGVAAQDASMDSAPKAWPTRLLATATALALLVAYVAGAYAHAAGHALPEATQGVWAVGHAGGHSAPHAPVAKAAVDKPGHHGDRSAPGQSAPDCCCDTICHGGQAILAPEALVLPPPHSVPVMAPVASFDGAEPGGLDRPP